MDFGYKVIRNRLGSLVANAIQKKTKEAVFIVHVIMKSSATVDKNSNDVINAMNNGIPVLYIVDTEQEGETYKTISTNITNLGNAIQVAMVMNASTIGSFLHIGTTIQRN